jgi:TP901 family phage tail tape measure protein
MNIGTLTAILGVDTQGLARAQTAMQQFQQSTEASMLSVAKTLDKTGRNIYYFGTAAMRFLTFPLALAGGAAVKMGMDFESSMQKVVGLVGISQKQVDAWGKEILKLGPELGRSPKELADALYFITSSGIKGAEAMNVLTLSAKASVAGLGETKAIADLVTSAMNAYAASGLSAQKTLDVLVAAVREGKGEATDFAKQMGEVLPVASRMGVGFDQVAASMSAMTLTGTSVSESATYMRQILMTLLDPAAGVQSALLNMGISGRKMRQVIREEGLLSALMLLNDSFKMYGESMAGKVFPNVRALTGVLSLMGDRLEANQMLFGEVTNSMGDFNKAVEAAQKTLAFAYNQALASVKTSMIEFALSLKDQLIPIMKGFAGTIQNLTQWYLHLSSGQQRLVLYLGLTLAAIGPLAIGVGLLLRGIGGLVIAGRAAISMLMGLRIAMMSNPITALVTVLGTCAAAMLLFNTNTKKAVEVQEKFNEVLERGKTLLSTGVDINAQMAVIDKLNQAQLQGLKENIIAQSRLMDEQNAVLLSKTENGSFRMVAAKKGSDEEQYILQREANAKQLALYDTFLKQVEAKLKFARKEVGEDIRGKVDTAKFVLEKLKMQSQILKDVGEDYEFFTSKITESGRTVSSLRIKIPKLEMDQNIDYRQLLLKTTDLGPMVELQGKLAAIAAQNSLLGDSFDKAGTQARTYGDQIAFVQGKMQGLMDQGVYSGDLMENYRKQLTSLQEEQRKFNFVQDIGTIISQEFSSALQGEIENSKALGNALRTAALDAIQAIIAKAVAMEVAKGMESSKNPWLALVIGAAAGAAAKALFSSIIPKFAEGGQVPAGYPNDTYPALLTSGEIITPANKVPSQNNQLEGEVVFRIHQDELWGILQKKNNKLKVL